MAADFVYAYDIMPQAPIPDAAATTRATAPLAAGCAWIDGDYLPIAEARIPIIDTGFSRSDVTYDVVAVWHGRFFRLDDHLDRFERNWRTMRMSPPVTRDEMRSILLECVRRSGLRDAYVDMIVSRGVAPHGERDPRLFENRFYAYAIPYVWIVDPAAQKTGTHLVIARDTIRIPPNAVDPTVKNFHWGDLIRGLFEAYDRGGTLVVLTDAEGNVTEGPGFNVFACHEDTLLTPARGALEGITRQTVMELAERQGIEVRPAAFGAEVMRHAAEIFITSTAGGIMPVTTLDGRAVGDGRVGPITLCLQHTYWAAHEDPRWSLAVDYADG